MVILFCALLAHTAAATALWLQEVWCPRAPCFCIDLSFDPNPYKALLEGSHETGSQATGAVGVPVTSSSVVLTLAGNLILGLLTGCAAYHTGRSVWIRNFIRPDILGWALEVSDSAAGADQVVTAYVVTKLGDDGFFAGYEGMVEKLSMGENGTVGSLVLSSVDRFVVKVDIHGVWRINKESDSTMPILAISGDEIANASFTTFDLTDLPGYDAQKFAAEDEAEAN